MEIKIRKFSKSKTCKKYTKNANIHSIEPLTSIIENTLKNSEIQLYKTYGNFFWGIKMKKIYSDPAASQLVCNVITEFLAEEFDALTIEKANELGTHYINLSNKPSNFTKKASAVALITRAKKNSIAMIRDVFAAENTSTGMMPADYFADDNEVATLCACDFEGHKLHISFENERNEVLFPEITGEKQ